VPGSRKLSGTPVSEATRSLAATYSADVEADVEVVLGQTIGRYQIRRILGRGGMGRVYLARDVVLGRSVALKIVGGSSYSERFLHEARAIAMLNHPNIVQLYDYGEHDHGIFLALEYVEGETLRERIRRGPIGLDEALRHSSAIADALLHAHAANVFHCDLKPSNVMVGRDGRVRVVDFGIARIGGDATVTSSGTPDWMAPEQWRNGPVTDRVDVWALAIVSCQLFSGRHPLGDDPERRSDTIRDSNRIAVQLEDQHVPPSVVDLVTRSLAIEPTQRPSASEWHCVLDNVIAGRSDGFTEAAPYPGLSAFDEQQARFYFGREREIDEFLERLREAPHVAIVAPSGAGKSSFLHAGVVPRLRARERWTVIAFRPGSDPVGALARHVVSAMVNAGVAGFELDTRAHSQAFRAELLETPTLLAARLATLAATCDGRVLVAVDQLEEAFTQGASEIERTQFLKMVLAAADDPQDPVRVLFTVRDDFFSKIPGLRSVFIIQKLGVDDLRRTIAGPLARCRYEFDDVEIIDDLISEVGSAEVADLPLLQFACRTLWDGRDVTTRRLRRATYKEMGGLAGALARHAEHAMAALSHDERRITRQLLLQLVTGTTRRSVARDQLITTVGAEAGAVLDRLLSARLLVQHSQGDGDGAIVEIAHESLLQTWSQLARWVDESRDERRLLEELEDATSLWERRGKRDEETWSQNDLVTARHRASQLGLSIPERVEAFLAAGDRRHRAQLRKRRIRYGMALAAGGAIAVLAFVLIARYLAREQLIRTNAGTVDLVLMPFDWIDGAPTSVPVDQLPDLSWKLYAMKVGNPHDPGEPIPTDLVDRLSESIVGNRRSWRVRAPGGTVFLEISGRGRAGEHCASSWIRILDFPGYATANASAPVELAFPTCRTSRLGMITIEAGPFIYGGPGDPPSSHYGQRDYDEPERTIDLRAFAIDRTEVSNAAFAPFASLASITGYPAPVYSNDTVHAHDRDPDYPVTEIDAYEAEAYCRYLGKQLPGDFEWVKAARGGLTINGKPNPMPRRLFPWGNARAPTCVNQDGLEDGYDWVAPVDALPCGASPYGVLNLAGNAQEWIGRAGQSDPGNPLHAMRGGATDSPVEREHISTIFRNHRDPRRFDYSIGLRCMSPIQENSP
jgi:formylglycine-generating enzyme required for sulfatase activity